MYVHMYAVCTMQYVGIMVTGVPRVPAVKWALQYGYRGLIFTSDS